MEILLIRHGQTKSNREKRYMGTIDEPITQEAVEVAKATAAQLPPVDQVFISPKLRCQQTAALLFPNQKAIVIQDLREMDFGRFEGKNYEDLKEDPSYRQWLDSDGTMPCPDGECRVAFAERCGAAFWQLVEAAEGKQQRLAIVAHGGTLMALLGSYAVEEKPYYEWLRPNCCGYRLLADPVSHRLQVLEEIGVRQG